MTTVHIQAGRTWRDAVKPRENLKILGLSVLTSLSPDDLAALDHRTLDPSALVLQRAKLAQEASLSGLVCSGREAAAARGAIGPQRLIVCPGIRPTWSLVNSDDQARVTTPAQAIKAGADLIVVGRPIRTAADAAAAADRVAGEISAGT
jgi:orotidine-5'-phosphate decarboxylase